MQNRVFVINKHGEALMPCKTGTARKLLAQGKAKPIKKEPFTIQLLYGSTGYKQSVSLGIDSGQRHIGIAVTSQAKVLFQGEVELRQDVKTDSIVGMSYQLPVFFQRILERFGVLP